MSVYVYGDYHLQLVSADLQYLSTDLKYQFEFFILNEPALLYTDTIKYPTVCPIYLIKWLF